MEFLLVCAMVVGLYWLVGYLEGGLFKRPNQQVKINALQRENLALLKKNYELYAEKNSVTRECNALIDAINERGGMSFLRGETQQKSAQFNQDEPQDLLRLCHPDVHNSSVRATRMTQKILGLRK